MGLKGFPVKAAISSWAVASGRPHLGPNAMIRSRAVSLTDFHLPGSLAVQKANPELALNLEPLAGTCGVLGHRHCFSRFRHDHRDQVPLTQVNHIGAMENNWKLLQYLGVYYRGYIGVMEVNLPKLQYVTIELSADACCFRAL